MSKKATKSASDESYSCPGYNMGLILMRSILVGHCASTISSLLIHQCCHTEAMKPDHRDLDQKSFMKDKFTQFVLQSEA